MDTNIAEASPAQAEAPSKERLIQRSSERLETLRAHDAELEGASLSDESLQAIRRCETTIESVAKLFDLYADRRCLGERAREGDDGASRWLPRFDMLSYAEVWRRVTAFASGLAWKGLAEPGAFVGICGFGSADWVEAYLACLYLSSVSVPLQTNMTPVDLQQIIQEAELVSVVCSEEQLELISNVLPACPSVRSVIVMDRRDRSTAKPLSVPEALAALSPRVSVHAMSAIESVGREKGIRPPTLPSARHEDDPLMTLSYTSGSTGTPKGAMMREHLLRGHWHSGFFGRRAFVPDMPQIALNYMPLNHAAGWASVVQALMRGGVTYFVAKSDMSTLFDDIRLARPTSLLLVPRVARTIYQHFQGELVRRTCGMLDADEAARERIAGEIMAEMRGRFLGDRLLVVLTGTAPTPPEVVDFMKRCFVVPVIDGYGSTEAGPLTLENEVDPETGVTFRLVDVPDLGYRTTDAPYPRGELHVKSPWLVPGYYKNERATKDLFDADGFMNTGDIVEQRSPHTLVWIDRAKNVLKLAQGEFVATSRLEGLYASRSPFIKQIFVYGSGMYAYLLAVVVPDLDAAMTRLRVNDVDDASLKQLLRSEIQRVAAEEKLHGYEIPRDLLIERDPFTMDNGLLTGSAKPSRPKLRARYGERLEALYGDIERAQVEELYGLHGARGEQSVAEKVKRAMEVTLGLEDIDVNQESQSFIQLGGDSLSAVGLETLIEDICGVRVPVGFLLDRTSSVRAVVDYVERALAGDSRTVSFEDVHGDAARIVRASDLRIEAFLSPAEMEAARRATPASELPVRAEVAFVTGANGFLGRFLVLDLLERLGGARKVYAVVRAPTDLAAFDRLADSFRTDPALEKRFDELAAGGRLVALAGDLMRPRFGLASDVYARLTEEVDLVVHNGALVNHAFDYRQLFEPNVLGTIEMIRFSVTQRVKSLAYVSTVGVMAGREAPNGQAFREDEDIRTVYEDRPIDSGYAVGYATSKWASELLLRDAHDKLKLPVGVYRASGIMAHPSYRGQLNVPDFFTRLIVGIVSTGIAPKSFYTAEVPSSARHYDGTPVDAVAREIIVPAVHRSDRWETFHVVNAHHDDGVSLDTIVDFLSSWGTTDGTRYRIERVADYDAWYRLFHDRLVALPEEQRQHSPLPILRAWAHPQSQDRAFDDALLVERLRAVSPELAVLPHVDEDLIAKYLDDLLGLGIIAPP